MTDMQSCLLFVFGMVALVYFVTRSSGTVDK